MDTIEAIKKLARLAREERAPMTDISARVLRRIRAKQELSLAPIWVFAAISATVAAGVVVLAVHNWISWDDPLVAQFLQFQMVVL